MSRRVNTKFRRSKKRLQKQIKILMALYKPLSNENMVRMSPPSMPLRWAWAASPGCLHLPPTDPASTIRVSHPECRRSRHGEIVASPARNQLSRRSRRPWCRPGSWGSLVEEPNVAPLAPPRANCPARSWSCQGSSMPSRSSAAPADAAAYHSDARWPASRRDSCRLPPVLVPPAPIRAKSGRRAFRFAGHKQPQLAPVINVEPEAQALQAVRRCIRPPPALARQRRTQPRQPPAVSPPARRRSRRL